jgi:hypothetical protein
MNTPTGFDLVVESRNRTFVERTRRIEWSSLVYFIGMAVWVATTAYLQRPFVGDYVDDGQYLVSARSLRDLGGYRLPSRPGSPVATKYPLGTSVIAALAMAILPGAATITHDWLAGKIVVVCAGVVFAEASRRFLVLSGFSLWAAGLLSLAVVWHPIVMNLTATLMSDVPFAAISTVLLVRWVRRTGQEDVPTTAWAVDGVLAGSGWLLRGNGVTLVVAVVAASFRRPFRPLATVAVLAGVACLWLPAMIHMRTMSGPRDSGGYAAEMKAAYKTSESPWSLPVANIMRIPGVSVSAIASPTTWTAPISSAMSRWPALRWLANITALGLLGLGVRQLIRRKSWPPPVWIHASLTLLVFVLWHCPIDNRFTLPLFPLVLAACALGLEAATAGRIGAITFSAITTTSSILVVLGVIVPNAVSHGGVLGGGRNPAIAAMFEAIRAKTPHNAVIIAPNPELVYLLTDRISIPMRADTAYFARRPTSWDDLKPWLRMAGDRPVYLLDAPALALADDRVGGVGPLLEDGRVGPEPIAAGSEGRLWRVERRDEP